MKGIFILSILVGISYVFAAIITKKNPTFIAGYSKFDEAQQKTFPNFLNKILIITGIITFVGCSIFTLLEWNIMAVIFLIMPSVIMIFIALIREKKTESKKATKIRILFFLLFILIIPAFIIISSKEPSVLFESDNIKITGLYGESIPVKDIAEVTMLKHIPPIQLRTNGFALGTVYKGYFLIGETETVKLFLNSASAPCIKIKTVENK
ncbi:MAG: hypothetical protein LBE71_01435, partial [Dysgonamonadaceae bacterium]|nr:hypothetical protein [Dysgonamonadaceae bacterium]